MGKAKKEHRKKVAKRNARIKQAEESFNKKFKQMMELEFEKYRKEREEIKKQKESETTTETENNNN